MGAPGTVEAGCIEGYYGRSLGWAERRRLIDILAELGAGHYLLAPKQERLLRTRWRDPLPSDWSAAYAATAAQRQSVRLVPGLSPGLDIDYDDDADMQCVCEKLSECVGLGSPEVALLLDDIAFVLPAASRFASLAEAQIHLIRKALDRLSGLAGFERLWVCPTVYADTLVPLGEPGYLERFLKDLPEPVALMWSGRSVVAEDFKTLGAIEGCGRPVLLWDNYYANDYCPQRLFLGPLRGRTPLPGSVSGHLLNLTGLPLTDAFLLGAFAADPDAARTEALERAGVDEGIFAKLLPFFDGPFSRPEPPDDWQAVADVALTLALEGDSPLVREWYPQLLMLPRDLKLAAGEVDDEWIRRYYSALTARLLSRID